jgi:uncharacterized membrane protein
VPRRLAVVAVTSTDHAQTEESRPSVARVLASPEGRILATGLAMTLLLFAAFGIAWLVAPEPTMVLAAMTGLNLMIGRASGLSFGYAHGLDHATVILGNMLVETIQVMVVYPLFALSWQHLLDLPRLKPLMSRMRHDAESGRPWVQHFGIAGVFIFVFVPFWMTGPVVGAIIGFLIGLRPGINLLAVLSGTYLASVLWALLLSELQAIAGPVNRYAVVLVAIALALLALVWRLLARRH